MNSVACVKLESYARQRLLIPVVNGTQLCQCVSAYKHYYTFHHLPINVLVLHLVLNK